MIIAVDGPSGSGKSTASIKVAAALGISYLDTGAIYRAVAIAGGVSAIDLTISTKAGPAQVLLNGQDVSQQIRTPEVTSKVSLIAAEPAVRSWVNAFVSGLGLTSCVIEGRDIGTVVAPDARLKIYLTANENARSQRRASEWGSDEDVARALNASRDSIDAARDVAPLAKAVDAIEIDSTSMSIDDVVNEIVRLAKERM